MRREIHDDVEKDLKGPLAVFTFRPVHGGEERDSSSRAAKAADDALFCKQQDWDQCAAERSTT